MKPSILTVNQQYEIRRIAAKCIEKNPQLDFSKAYIITLFYYLMQYCDYSADTIPDEYIEQAKALYKDPKSSYIHYLSKVKDSNDIYVYAIKNAELDEKGDDPRFPWNS